MLTNERYKYAARIDWQWNRYFVPRNAFLVILVIASGLPGLLYGFFSVSFFIFFYFSVIVISFRFSFSVSGLSLSHNRLFIDFVFTFLVPYKTFLVF